MIIKSRKQMDNMEYLNSIKQIINESNKVWMIQKNFELFNPNSTRVLFFIVNNKFGIFVSVIS
jgi:hypothetical protein